MLDLESLFRKLTNLIREIGYLENVHKRTLYITKKTYHKGGSQTLRFPMRRRHETHDYHLRHTRKHLARLIKVIRKLRRENGEFEE